MHPASLFGNSTHVRVQAPLPAKLTPADPPLPTRLRIPGSHAGQRPLAPHSATVALPHSPPQQRFPLGNFAENQLVGRSMSISPLATPRGSELHVSTPTPFHPRFDGLQAGHGQFTCPSGRTRTAPSTRRRSTPPAPTRTWSLSLRHSPARPQLAVHIHSLTSVSRRAEPPLPMQHRLPCTPPPSGL